MRKLIVSCAVAALAAVPVGATSYVRMSDEALVDSSPVAVVVRVEAQAPAPDGRAATDYRVRVEEVLKGQAPESLTVRVPGGGGGDIRLKVYGAPEFKAGERALLLLRSAADGTWRINQLFLGAFHEVNAGGRRLAVRDLSEVSEMRLGTDAPKATRAEPEPLRDLDSFARWIAGRAKGVSEADYRVEAAEGEGLRAAVDQFTLFEDDATGLNMRWFEFDTGGNIGWRAHNGGQPGVSGGGFTQFQNALSVWKNENTTPVDYRYLGKTASEAGFDEFDDLNAILFGDPSGYIAEGPFDCSDGGVLAIGGPWYLREETDRFRGEDYHIILGADILTNANLACFFGSSPNTNKAAEELFAHELGHTLGIGHSNTQQALMFAFIHDDGRGAGLHADDRAALQALYQQGSGGGTPAAPTGLAASAASTTVVDLTWVDNSTNETEFRVEVKALGGVFLDIGSVPANEESAEIEALAPATHYTFRVRARNAAGNSAYSNEVTVTTNGSTAACVANDTTLCLANNRFKVQVTWETQSLGQGAGHVVPGAANNSGLFWFFSPDNWELLIKTVNGCSAPPNGNNKFWVFFSATTNVEYVVTVIDTQTGAAKQYYNADGQAAVSVNDTSAFATCNS
jgi:hypothetical protein